MIKIAKILGSGVLCTETETGKPGVIHPGGDISGLSKSDQERAKAFWTTDVINAWHDAQNAPLTLDESKLSVIALINTLRDQKTASPFTHDGKILDADKNAQMAIAHAISYGQLNAMLDVDPRTWTLADNTTETITWGVFRAMASAMFERASALHDDARIHKDAVNAMADIVEIDAYDITTGWAV